MSRRENVLRQYPDPYQVYRSNHLTWLFSLVTLVHCSVCVCVLGVYWVHIAGRYQQRHRHVSSSTIHHGTETRLLPKSVASHASRRLAQDQSLGKKFVLFHKLVKSEDPGSLSYEMPATDIGYPLDWPHLQRNCLITHWSRVSWRATC